MHTYFEYLVNTYNKTVDEFDALKADVVKEIERLTPVRAEEIGAGYASRIERLSSTGAKIRSLTEQITAYKYMNGDHVDYKFDENEKHIIITKAE